MSYWGQTFLTWRHLLCRIWLKNPLTRSCLAFGTSVHLEVDTKSSLGSEMCVWCARECVCVCTFVHTCVSVSVTTVLA